MKLRKDDQVIVITGRDKGKTGKVLAVIPDAGKVLVEQVNVVKRHTKPSAKNARGGILDLTKPIDVSKVMAIDPASGRPARVGYKRLSDGTKERIFKVSHHQPSKKKSTKSTGEEKS